ncbi:MAG: hypothetical protein J0I28_09965 [Caulobacterales bacterium]|nr:hypothetical protein [Caulobacterales bacterium]
MPTIIEGPPGRETPKPLLARRLIWFVGLAVASALATVVVAYGLKALLPPL